MGKTNTNSQLTSQEPLSQSNYTRRADKENYQKSSSVVSSYNKKRNYNEITKGDGSQDCRSRSVSPRLLSQSTTRDKHSIKKTGQSSKPGQKRLKVEKQESQSKSTKRVEDQQQSSRGRAQIKGSKEEVKKSTSRTPNERDQMKPPKGKSAQKTDDGRKSRSQRAQSKSVTPIRANNQKSQPKERSVRKPGINKKPSISQINRPQRSTSKPLSNADAKSGDKVPIDPKNGKKSKSTPSHDSVYSNSYKYKTTSNNRGDRYDKKKGKDTNKRRSSRSPHVTNLRGQSKSNSRSPPPVAGSGKNPKRNQSSSKRSKGPKISEDWNTDEDGIREVMDMYFKYIIEEKCTRLKLKNIIMGEFMQKKLFIVQKQIEIRISNLCFELCNNTDRDFSECDLIEFNTSLRQKDLPSLYIIRQIIIKLDYSGKQQKTEKQDKTLPDIEIVFKVHPVFQMKNLPLFPEAQQAAEHIVDKVDSEYVLDHKGSICLFEIGKRKWEDPRLEFERFVYNLSNIQKSYLFLKENPRTDIQQDIKQVKSKNQLKTNYDKCYIIYYGYKYEDPHQIYSINQNKLKDGNSTLVDCIKRWDPNANNNTSKQSSNLQESSTVKSGQAEVESSSAEISDLHSSKNPAVARSELREGIVENSNQSTGKIVKLSNKIEETKRTRGNRKHTKPISVIKSNLINEDADDRTISEDQSENNDEVDDTKMVPSKTTKVVPSKTYKIDPYQKSSQSQSPKRSRSDRKKNASPSGSDASGGVTRTKRRTKRFLNERSASAESGTVSDNSYTQKSPKPSRTVRKSKVIPEESDDASMRSQSEVSVRPARGLRGRSRQVAVKAAEEQRAEYASSEDDDQSVLGGKKNSNNNFDNEYDEACSKLQLNSIPETLPCRDREQEMIYNYITEGIANQGSSSSLYISGMPGTGKTATTLEVVRKILNEKKEEKARRKQHGRAQNSKMRNLEYIHINAMSLTNPNAVYTILCEKITGRRLNPQSAAQFLDEFFKKKDKKGIALKALSKTAKTTKTLQGEAQRIADKIRIVLIDELDALITTKQTLLYNLFDWPCHQNSKLLLISIANTMDLPERLQSKITSRIGNNRLVYEPYTSSQIKDILQSRLTNLSIFEPKSLDLVSKKVAQYSGDIRRSLQITKRAVELCRQHYTRPGHKSGQLIKVSMKHIMDAYDEMANSKTVQVLNGLRKLEIIVIISLFLELKTQKSDKVLIDSVQDRCDIVINQMRDAKSTLGARTAERNDQIMSDSENENSQKVTKFYKNWEASFITTTMFREIVKRLQAFGLINLVVEPTKITDNSHLQLFVYFDEIKNAFQQNEIYQRQQDLIELHKDN